MQNAILVAVSLKVNKNRPMQNKYTNVELI